MSREGQLGHGREDANPRMPAGLGRQDEHGLAQVHLASDFLQQLLGYFSRVGEDGELIALERGAREDVGQHIAEGGGHRRILYDDQGGPAASSARRRGCCALGVGAGYRGGLWRAKPVGDQGDVGPQALRHRGRQTGHRQGRRVLPGVVVRARLVQEHPDTVGSRLRRGSPVQPAQHRVPSRRRRAGGRLRLVGLRQDRLSLPDEQLRLGRIALGQESAAQRDADRREHSARARPYVRTTPCAGVVVRSKTLRRRELRRSLRHDGQRDGRLRLVREVAARMDHAGDTPFAAWRLHDRPDRGAVERRRRGSSSRRHATATGSKYDAIPPATRPEPGRCRAGLLVHAGPSPTIAPGLSSYGGLSNALILDPVGRGRPWLQAGDRFGEPGAFRIVVLGKSRLLVQTALRLDGHDAAQTADNRVSWSPCSALGRHSGDVARLERTRKRHCRIPDVDRRRAASLDHAEHLPGVERSPNRGSAPRNAHAHHRRDRPGRQPQSAGRPALCRRQQLTPEVNVLAL